MNRAVGSGEAAAGSLIRGMFSFIIQGEMPVAASKELAQGKGNGLGLNVCGRQ